MNALQDTNYKHWQGEHLGIWRRRAVIAANGLKASLQGKWMRHLILLSWVGALVQIAFLFLIGQLLIADSLVVQWVANLNRDLQNFARALVTWLEKNPQISVRTTQNMLFFFFSTRLAILSLVAVALAIPHLITRDLSSNAIVIYSSKAVGRFDYLLGKFATLFALMILTWLGPVCLAWFVGNLLSTKWHFFWHSRLALTHTLVYVLSGMTVLSLLGLGISAFSAKAKATVGIWIGFWILGNAFVPIAIETKAAWLKFFSLSFDLKQISLAVFNLKQDFKIATDNIPFFGQMLRGIPPRNLEALQNPELTGALIGLSLMVLIALLIIGRRVKPE